MARAKLYRLDDETLSTFKPKGQAMLIVNSLLLKSPQTAQDIAADIKAKLETRQDPIRVVSFYMSTWKKSGLVKVVGTTEAPVSTGISSSSAVEPDNESENHVSQFETTAQDTVLEELPVVAEEAEFDYENSSIKDAVLHTLRRFELGAATAQDIADELVQCGRPVNKNQVRDALGKLGKDGKVNKGEAGSYVLSHEYLQSVGAV